MVREPEIDLRFLGTVLQCFIDKFCPEVMRYYAYIMVMCERFLPQWKLWRWSNEAEGQSRTAYHFLLLPQLLFVPKENSNWLLNTAVSHPNRKFYVCPMPHVSSRESQAPVVVEFSHILRIKTVFYFIFSLLSCRKPYQCVL